MILDIRLLWYFNSNEYIYKSYLIVVVLNGHISDPHLQIQEDVCNFLKIFWSNTGTILEDYLFRDNWDLKV